MKKCDYPGCDQSARVRCSDCNHFVCLVHGNGGIEISPEEVAPLCWQCDGKGWGSVEEDRAAALNFMLKR